MVRKFPPFRSERKKRSTSEGTPQFPNGISGKLPYHLTSNRNFRIFWPNGKHPVSPCSSSEAAMFCSSSGTKSCLERFGLTFTGNVLPRHLFRLPEASILKKPILILTSISLAFDFVLTAFSLRPLRLKSGRTLRFFPFLKSSNPMVLLQFVDSFCFTL